jgi:hypothetical protein
MSIHGIQAIIKDIFNVDISTELISRVTDEVKGLVDEGHVGKKAVYAATELPSACEYGLTVKKNYRAYGLRGTKARSFGSTY